ncbi:MAG: sarcosine oxidase subunit alpha family protein [Casimicrobiaceae bacterium]
MRQINRLDEGGRIDRTEPLTFSFNDHRYTGFAGDTLASALLANGITFIARSAKYHRPRGIVTCGVEEPNAIVQLGDGAYAVPNARATQVELYDGLSARSVNCWPSVDFDWMACVELVSRVLPAGFYYKTFMWPKSFWMRYEQVIRRASGLGRTPRGADPDFYDKTYAHCDVLVAGAGAAGISAALAAGRAGARVMLADEQNEFGGSLLGSNGEIDGKTAAEWLRDAVAELASMREVTLIPRGTVYAYVDHNYLLIAQRLTDHLTQDARKGPRERIWRVRAAQVVLATGAHERPLVFRNNDRPGVMMASAVSTYINRYAVKPAETALIFTNNDSAYLTALDLHRIGVRVAGVVDARRAPDGELPRQVRGLGIEVLRGCVISDVTGTKRVTGAKVMRLEADGTVRGSATHIACDLIAVSGGWNPVIHLSAQSGAKAVWNERRACFLPGTPVQRERSAGGCAGEFTMTEALLQGTRAGAEAARLARLGETARVPAIVDRTVVTEAVHLAHASEGPVVPATASDDTVGEESLMPLWLVPGRKPVGRGGKQFVDLQNDVTAADIFLAAREGFHSIEHTKRYTALGFGTDQGKLGNVNGMAILAQALGQSIADTGTTTFRPNYTPVTFGAIAGREVGELFDPVRKTSLHAWHLAHGALFENVGQWQRPWYFPNEGEDLHAAVKRECLAVRHSVGIMDASTLGKIDIQGPDAAEFLNRVYTNAWTNLKVGSCRYGMMLGEDGMVKDDGVTTRVAENRYLMTTTTGGAAAVMAWLERWLQTEWPHLKVYFTSVTEHWATIAVAGPRSREVMGRVCTGIDFAKSAFPFMTFREGTVAGTPCRVMRISFSGELAYEINVDANDALRVWEALKEAGRPFAMTPYGTESMHVLRAEKGFIIVGQETDGSVTPVDLGMDWIIGKAKGDFIGKRSLARPDTARPDRKQLVGLLTVDPLAVLPEGGQIVADASVPVPIPMLGHVTSSYYSACLGRSIALGLVKDGRRRHGETVHVPLASGQVIAAIIGDTVFIDPQGERQHV